MRHDIRTEIDIEAPPEEVCPPLVDLTAYADWNPFITSATGSAEEGRRLSLRMEPPGGRAATVHPRVTQVSTAAALEWLGPPGVPGLFDVRPPFGLVPPRNGTPPVPREALPRPLLPPLPPPPGRR